MKPDEAQERKELEIENTRLKWLVADQALDMAILKEANSYWLSGGPDIQWYGREGGLLAMIWIATGPRRRGRGGGRRGLGRCSRGVVCRGCMVIFVCLAVLAQVAAAAVGKLRHG